MSNISKKLQFGMINFFRLGLFHLTQMQSISQTNTVTYHSETIINDTADTQYI